jgi:ubiquitin carboxyl-terminal hydrolase L5
MSSPLSSPISDRALNTLFGQIDVGEINVLDGARESKPAAVLEPPYQSATPEQLKLWPGWLELDSDELISNTLLREWGVSGLRLHPVFGLAEELIAQLPYPIYGVVFCFGYQNVDGGTQTGPCPDGVWFANQEPGSLNCGSLALLNIINNLPGVDLGPKLQEFKTVTMPLTSVERGEKLYAFEHVRAVHNSFVKYEDMAELDLYLVNSEKKAAAKSRIKGKRTSKPTTSPELSSAEYFDKDPAFHFIAYMPINNRIYKLDGLDTAPQDMGPCDHETWAYQLAQLLLDRMNAFEGDGIRYNLQAVVADDQMHLHDEEAEKAAIMREDKTAFVLQFLRFLAENGDLRDLAEKEMEKSRVVAKGKSKGRAKGRR